MNRVLPGAHVDPLSLFACRRARLQIWLPESTVGATRPGGDRLYYQMRQRSATGSMIGQFSGKPNALRNSGTFASVALTLKNSGG